VRDVALLVAVGVNDEGYREVLAVEAAAGERSETWRGLLQGLVGRGLRGVKLVISDDHDAIEAAVKVELPGAAWQRCVVHFHPTEVGWSATCSLTSRRLRRRQSPPT
jgi:transposase-like protein